MSKWQPIETAPKDKSLILVYRPAALKWGQIDIATWDDDRYAKKPRPYWRSIIRIMGKLDMRAWEPTHWQPLPEPPQAP